MIGRPGLFKRCWYTLFWSSFVDAKCAIVAQNIATCLLFYWACLVQDLADSSVARQCRQPPGVWNRMPGIAPAPGSCGQEQTKQVHRVLYFGPIDCGAISLLMQIEGYQTNFSPVFCGSCLRSQNIQLRLRIGIWCSKMVAYIAETKMGAVILYN